MNNTKTIKNKKIEYLKWFLVAASTVILAAIFVIIFVGFNTSVDFSGGSVLHVKLGNDLSEKDYYNESLGTIKDVLDDHNVCIYSVQTAGKLAEKSFIIKYKNTVKASEMEQINNQIRTTINEEFNSDSFTELDNEFDITTNSGIVTGVIAKTLFKSIVAIMAVITLTLLYFLFRKSLLLSLTMVGVMLLSVILTVALTALVRLPVSMAYITSLIAVCALTIITLILISEKLAANRDSKNSQDAFLVAFKPLLISSLVLFVFSATMFILAKAFVAEVIGAVLIGIIVNFVVVLFAGVPFLNIFNNSGQKKNKRTQNEVKISDKTSDKPDASAPVIEINEDNK